MERIQISTSTTYPHKLKVHVTFQNIYFWKLCRGDKYNAQAINHGYVKTRFYIVIYFTRDDLTSSMKATASSCKADEQKRISSELGSIDDQRCTTFLVNSAHLIVSWYSVSTESTWLFVFALARFSSRSVNMDILSSFRSTISSNWVKIVNSDRFIKWPRSYKKTERVKSFLSLYGSYCRFSVTWLQNLHEPFFRRNKVVLQLVICLCNTRKRYS